MRERFLTILFGGILATAVLMALGLSSLFNIELSPKTAPKAEAAPISAPGALYTQPISNTGTTTNTTPPPVLAPPPGGGVVTGTTTTVYTIPVAYTGGKVMTMSLPITSTTALDSAFKLVYESGRASVSTTVVTNTTTNNDAVMIIGLLNTALGNQKIIYAQTVSNSLKLDTAIAASNEARDAAIAAKEAAEHGECPSVNLIINGTVSTSGQVTTTTAITTPIAVTTQPPALNCADGNWFTDPKAGESVSVPDDHDIVHTIPVTNPGKGNSIPKDSVVILKAGATVHGDLRYSADGKTWSAFTPGAVMIFTQDVYVYAPFGAGITCDGSGTTPPMPTSTPVTVATTPPANTSTCDLNGQWYLDPATTGQKFTVTRDNGSKAEVAVINPGEGQAIPVGAIVRIKKDVMVNGDVQSSSDGVNWTKKYDVAGSGLGHDLTAVADSYVYAEWGAGVGCSIHDSCGSLSGCRNGVKTDVLP